VPIHDLLRSLRRRLFPAASLLLALAACATQPAADSSNPASAMAIMMFPECRDEIRAYVDLAHLAANYDRNGDVFGNALDDMEEQVLDCVTDRTQADENSALNTKSDLPARRRSHAPRRRHWPEMNF
jgi:hypothetical protein